MSKFSSEFVKDFVSKLFAQADIDRSAKSGKGYHSQSIDKKIYPFTISKKLTNLPNAGISNLEPPNVSEISPFSIGRLERVLVLANPLPAEPIKRPTLSVPVPVVEEKKTRAPRGSLKASAAESSRKKRLATLYHDQSRENSFAEVETVGKRKRREEIKEVLAAPAENTLIKHVPISTNSSSSSSLANDNLYTVLNTVFDVFWSMEIDESDVNHAFFSRISKANCAEYGLKSFSSEACCLAVVKDKLDTRYYHTADEFLFDFQTLLDNIFQHYGASTTAGHDQVVSAARDMSNQFDAVWEAERVKY